MTDIVLLSLISAIPFPTWLSENAVQIGSFRITWYGIAYVVGVLLAFLYAKRVCAKKELWVPTGVTRGTALIPNGKMLEDFVFFALLGIILGGRIGSILLYNTSYYLENPLKIFYVWEGGMAFHGGFLGVCAAVYYMARSRKMEIFRWADIVAIGAPIGLFLVRLTNFINQELWGRPTDLPWAVVFNKDSLALPRHPSQLYEAALEGLVLFLILRILTHRVKVLPKPGIVAGSFIALYGLFRTLVELVREPDAALIGPLTRGMAYSLPMIMVGVLIILWAVRRPPAAPRHVKVDDTAT